jgi:hypothetical protein
VRKTIPAQEHFATEGADYRMIRADKTNSSPDGDRSKITQHVSESYFFCTPVHSSAQGMIAVTDNRTFRAAQHFPSPVGTGSAVPAWLCRSIEVFF